MSGISRLVALHGYTQDGATLREALLPLLPAGLALACPDAPLACASSPGRTWWRATDDGSVYEGWEVARDRVAALLDERTAVLGFSQGAMLAACVAAWAARGELACGPVALVAGGLPRARDLQPLFAAPIGTPSLHVWGTRDPMADRAVALADRFVAPERVPWDGPHVVPARGAAADRLRSWFARAG